MEVISEVGHVAGACLDEVGQMVQIGQISDPAHGSLIGNLQVEVTVRSKVGVLWKLSCVK